MARSKESASTTHSWNRNQLLGLIEALQQTRREMLEIEKQCSGTLGLLHDAHRRSGINLFHYLALRRHDIRQVQEQLAELGLSSLGRAEAHVMTSLDSLLRVLYRLAGQTWIENPAAAVDFAEGKALLAQHTEYLFGPKPGQRRVRIMVTMPSEAADDYLLVRDLLAAGMDCMRINCVHDNQQAWERMIDNLHRAKRELGKKCRILMDLGGPKLRTGQVEEAARVIKWRPLRNPFGRILEPARILLMPEGHFVVPDMPADAVLTFSPVWLATLKTGDFVKFRDTRGAKRVITIVGESGPCRYGESSQTAYVAAGVAMRRRSPRKKGRQGSDKAVVGELPPAEGFILLKRGDMLVITGDPRIGRGAEYNSRGKLLAPAVISCSIPEVISQVHPGDRVWLDDGKIGGIIRVVTGTEMKVEIIHVQPQGAKLRAERGINFPDSRLSLSALSDNDIDDLGFVVRHAHMVGMSFAQNVDDVRRLQDLLAKMGKPEMGIVLKIETSRGFEMLPDLLLAAMQSPMIGVMIARGDMAVECGYERLAEVQEEMLWLCEAAHIPVIWATQVLDTLAKSGLPSRAEISDAAMSGRAECVMLGKGPYIREAVQVLDNILQRMEPHQSKKTALLRQLRWWERVQTHCKVPTGTSIRKRDAKMSPT